MAYKIAITYKAPAKQEQHDVASICALFMPTSAACDMDAFDGTYYDTNIQGYGFGSELDDFLAMQVSHPGLVAAMKQAAKDGLFEMETLDPSMKTMVLELNTALAAEGFKFEWTEA